MYVSTNPHFSNQNAMVSKAARIEWERIIKRDQPLGKQHRVCSAHFLEKDVILFDEHIVNGNVVRIPRERATLREGALPVIFENYPKYYQPKVSTRKPPAKRHAEPKNQNKVEENGSSTENANGELLSDFRDESVLDQNGDMPVHEPLQMPSPEKTTRECSQWNHKHVTDLILPLNWVVCNTANDDAKVLVHVPPSCIQIDKSITFQGNSAPSIVFRGSVSYEGNLKNIINSQSDAQQILNQVDMMNVCIGTGIVDKPFSVACRGSSGVKAKRCSFCVAERERLRKEEKRKTVVNKRLEEKKARRKRVLQSLKRSKANLFKKIQRYRKRITEVMQESSKKKKEVLDEAIKTLPKTQQEAVRACFEASTRKGPSGRRYTIEWIYECLLMKVRSTALYQHIRNNNILPLPCLSTIRGYLKHYSGAYGYNPSTVEMLSKKSPELTPKQRRGVFLVDEVKLSPGVHFNESTVKVEGFVDLEKQLNLDAFGEDVRQAFSEAMKKVHNADTPAQKRKETRREKVKEKNKNKKDRNLGDHALVITFQPLQGKWVQNIACFLTKNAANDDELTKLILEGIILVESSGFMVDGVITDGASWNRSMWKKFGISEDNYKAEHPCDPNRPLFFFSDFPHLLKCMRNCFIDKKVLETPQGSVKLDHWKAVVEADSLREVGLRECPRLTKDHLNPNNWTKMRCAPAWQFWSGSAAAGMESFRFQGVDKLEDCDESVALCKLVNRLADVMNSRTPKDALYPNSSRTQTIKEFLSRLEEIQAYLTETRHEAEIKAEEARIAYLKKHGKKFKAMHSEILKRREYVFSESTDLGLKVTLNATLQLLDYLTDKDIGIGFLYLMTARLNQDALERFFGLMRQSCGPNTHPEPKTFAQLFKLLSIYSLVKPIKGSNITGGEMLKTLLNVHDLRSKTNEDRKKELDQKLDNIVTAGEDLHLICDFAALIEDHSYIDESLDEFALVHVAGYTSRQSKKFTNGCQCCEAAIILQDPTEATDEYLLIKLKTRGYLTLPSKDVVNLLRAVEKTFVRVAKSNEMEENILFLVVENLEKMDGVTLVGCDLHRESLTKSVMKFYLIMRMHFLCKRWNVANKEIKEKQKSLRKQAHLT